MPGAGRAAITAALGLVIIGACCARSESGYVHFVRSACASLQERQEKLKADYRLDSWPRYDWNQETEALVFSQDGIPKVVAKIQFIGSYSKTSGTWRWAWANDTILSGMRRGSEKIKELGGQRGWRRLTTAEWPATEQDGWDMTAVAADVLDAKGAYRTPDDTGSTFMIITDIRWAESGPVRTNSGGA